MSAPYTTQSISGYNSNPPADDGSSTASNQVLWATVKTKLGDPVKTLSEAIDSALVSAFPKVIGGGGVTSTGVNYTVQSSDQGKLVRATASGITITTPDATTVTSPFVFAVLNNSSGSITLDGNGAQTIDGSANLSISTGAGALLFTDSSNWFTAGAQGVLVGKQLQSGFIINGTIAESMASNAVTYTLQTLAGNTPSSTDPVIVCFRNSTLGTGNYVYRTVTSATTLTISSGSTLGTTSAVACRIWLVLFDDAGTVRLGAINCRSNGGTSIYPLGRTPRASSTAEGGAGAADSAQTFYTGTAVTNKAYVVLAYATYESGQATAGTWTTAASAIELVTQTDPLPGALIQVAENYTGAVASGGTAIPLDDTIPAAAEGFLFMTQAITPTSAANILRITHLGYYSQAGTSNMGIALCQDGGAAIATGLSNGGVTGIATNDLLFYSMVAGTSSSTSFTIRVGDATGDSVTFNGNGGTRRYGGTLSSMLRVEEVVV